MNDKQPKYYNIKTLLGSDDYVIPIYQRNYEWGEPQITQLIQDIVDYILKSKVSENKPKYYIGSLIAYERKLEGSVNYETIDGQQRLTTLTILLNVIKNEYSTIDLSWYKKLNLSFDSRKIASNTLSYLFKDESLDNKECNVAIQQGYYDAKKSLAKILADNDLSIDEFCNYFFDKVTILRVLVPEDTDLNHYFEIMNSRGEQLEKHEILKAKMLEILEDDNLKYAFNLIWEATSNMEKYVQYGFSVAQRDELFGKNDWNNLVGKDDLYQKLQIPTANQTSEETLTISQLLLKTAKPISDNSSTTDESPDRFNTIINFANFLLHILRIQTKFDVPLDDKRLLELFEPYLKAEGKKEFVKQFGYNLLKGKFYFDKYVIKREFAKGSDHWSLKRLKWYDGNKVSYVNTFDADNVETNDGANREILMLLSMFHVSNPTLVYKHWLNASLKFVVEYSGTNLANDYKSYLENLAKSFLNDRYLAVNQRDFYEIIYTNNGQHKNSETDIEINKLNQGTAVENFIFNYLDYLLWQDYRTNKNYFKIKNGQAFTDNRVKDFEYTFRSSVEHYYPQHPIDENLILKGQDADWLDNFGNLCLISGSKNSRLSNFMPTAKKDYYTGSSTIDSIKQRIMMEYEHWDTNGSNNHNEIKEHCEKMTELLTR
ncbi:DUF262 domain-containing HNH endonuclease family protein [Flavobacterium sp. CBA20B-1]|uniref:DUF262 domain-containing HNH endonuclease family protein n=1 Tax=unclassified Flavobacterium TaxID=196869 RepID=UPI0022240B2F|nr:MULTISPECIES: DUF262 domain-containing HNH endonuclease family protein [unclassified Flavobacterium]WCM43183.1 DUF262 domain-containing HNH endonuclease family protein [Flavobacterium sp. CBA20B-1]